MARSILKKTSSVSYLGAPVAHYKCVCRREGDITVFFGDVEVQGSLLDGLKSSSDSAFGKLFQQNQHLLDKSNLTSGEFPRILTRVHCQAGKTPTDADALTFCLRAFRSWERRVIKNTRQVCSLMLARWLKNIAREKAFDSEQMSRQVEVGDLFAGIPRHINTIAPIEYAPGLDLSGESSVLYLATDIADGKVRYSRICGANPKLRFGSTTVPKSTRSMAVTHNNSPLLNQDLQFLGSIPLTGQALKS